MVRRFFFFISWFTDPPTRILHFRKKKKIYIFDFFFIFSDVKKLPDLRKLFFKILKKKK